MLEPMIPARPGAPRPNTAKGNPSACRVRVSEGHENYGCVFHGYLINTVSNIKQSNIN